MKTLILLGLLTGLDNLQVSPALGMIPMSASRRWLFALTFGLCEALMPIVGLFVGQGLHTAFAPVAEKLGPIALLACGAAILFMVLQKKEVSALFSRRWALIGLPLALSIDNLLAGLGVGASGYPLWLSAVVIGGISTGMCWLGLALGKEIGKGLSRWFPQNLPALSGAYLVLLGLGTLWHSFGQ